MVPGQSERIAEEPQLTFLLPRWLWVCVRFVTRIKYDRVWEMNPCKHLEFLTKPSAEFLAICIMREAMLVNGECVHDNGLS